VFGNITTSDTVPAHLDFVESTDYATSLKSGQAYARTIEHFMAVLHAYHISNLQVKISGEIPIMDGSALEFCQLIEEAGIDEQDAPLEEIVIEEKYVVGDPSPDSKYISIEPHPAFTVKYLLNYPSPVGKQEFSFTLKDAQSFKDLIAPARTFGFLKDIGELQKRVWPAGESCSTVFSSMMKRWSTPSYASRKSLPATKSLISWATFTCWANPYAAW